MKTNLPIALLGLALAALLAAAAAAQDAPAGSGTEDDPWLIDVDELLAEGYAVIVAPDTTVVMSRTMADTIRVSAPRVRVSEIVRRVAETMEDLDRNAGPVTFSTLMKVDIWDHRGDAEKEKHTEIVEVWRQRSDPEGEELMTRLHQREREWKAGELVKDETDAEVTREWQEEVADEMMAMPFSLLTANAYRYEIKERTLIGDHLVFRIGFSPRSPFEPGLEGDVWIDYSDFVIRRMSGRLVGPMPVPMIMKGVPRFTFTLRRIDERWVAEGLRAEILLNGALPGVPEQVELSMSFDDYAFGDAALAEDLEVRP